MNNQDSLSSRTGFNLHAIRALSCALLLLLGGSSALQAQITTAALRGTVTDEQGATIAGAEVTITNVDTGFTRAVTSAGDGAYNFPDLPLGTFKIRVTHAGFKTSEQVGIALHASDSLVFNTVLKLGSVSEQVTVEASAVQVETTNGELAGLINGQQVAELPLNGRNFMQLVLLVPGVATGEGFSAQGKGLKGGSDLSIGGGAVDANLWLVDGAHNNDVGSNRTILVFPSVDAIDEFKIERNSYSAQFGQSAGSQISIITKHGGNDFHGDVYYFGRNDKLNTFNTFVKSGCLAGGTPCVKNKLRRNDYGYTFGGPVKKDKIFFFWSQEWNKQVSGTTSTHRVPTVAEKGGDFRDIAACPSGFNGFPAGGLRDPANKDINGNGLPFPTPNVIPTNRLSPVAQLVLKAYPDPTNPDPCASNNYTKSFGVPTNWREEHVRGDINLTKTLTAMLRFTNDSWNIGPNSGGFWGDNNLGPIGEAWNQPGRVVIGKLSKTIGSTAVNDFTFSYSANRITITQAGTNPGLVQQLNDAIPTFFPLSGKTYGDKGPAVWVNCCGLPSVWTIAPWQNQQDLYTWQDDFSFVMGKHTIKVGGLYARNYKAEQGNGEFGTLGGPVGLNGFKGSKNQTGYGNADLELLNMAMGWSEVQNLFKIRNVWHDVEFYVTDNWRVTPRLTVDYGFRWSFLRNPYLSDDRYTAFNPAAFDPALGNAPCNGLLYSPGLGSNPCPAGTGGVAGPNRALMNNNNHMIAPRLGIAWDPTGTGKWSIRAGLGQFFNRDRLWPLQIAGNNPPFDPSFNSPGGNGRFLDQPFTTQLPACTPNCYASGLGLPSIGQSTSDQMPNAWQWNLSVQREVFKDAKLEVAYVANKNNHWEQIADVNFVPVANRLTYVQNENSTAKAGDPEAHGFPNAGAYLASFRPFGTLVGNNSITYYSHGSSSNYQSLQMFYNMRVRSHATFQAAYTWSKLLADSQRLDTPPPNVDGGNRHASYGPDLLNHPHIFSSSLVYQLPALQGSNGFVRGALGGWEASTIVSLSSGPSITPLVSIEGFGDPSGVGNGTATGRERPNRVAGQSCRASGADSTTYLNPNMFTVSGYQLGTIGNAGIGICSGPPTRDVDFGVDKNFRVTERIKIQFRMEFFNLFNHPQYVAQNVIDNAKINFNGAVFGDANGKVVTPDANGVLNGATQILSATRAPSSNYGQSQNVRENGFRQIQYALKVIF